MTERRYNEAEVAAIFEAAAEEQQAVRRQLPPGEGMTLADLQEIGREVGIPAETVARAARTIEQGGLSASRTFLGLPIGVGRTVVLDRRRQMEGVAARLALAVSSPPSDGDANPSSGRRELDPPFDGLEQLRE